jgi:Zn-dependent M16 (insulinase) family peptidase
MKRCSKCKESKELVCFYKNISKSDGFCIHCKSCIAERKRKYNQANAEKIAERKRKYYQSNAEKVAERKRKYRQANAEKVAERQRKYNQANAEKIAERGRKYYQVKKQEEAANLFFQMAHFASEITKTTITP